jgi:hypothetical protein
MNMTPPKRFAPFQSWQTSSGIRRLFRKQGLAAVNNQRWAMTPVAQRINQQGECL